MMSLSRVLLLVAVTSTAAGQPTAPAAIPVAGTVTGTITCADTQRPARFVQVMLVRKPDADDLKPAVVAAKPDPKRPQVMGVLVGRTGLDGSYTIRGVPPADYWVLARLPGYILPVGRVPDVEAAKDTETVMRAVPLVHVSGDGTSTLNVSMIRGAVISGKMQFEDGAPVAGIVVQAEPTEGGNATYVMEPRYLAGALGYTRDNVVTDDDGKHRIAGLPPGKYVVSTQISIDSDALKSNMNGTTLFGQGVFTLPITIYAAGAFHKRDARVFELAGAEQVADANLELALGNLHSVHGKVLVTEGGHPPDHVLMRLVDETDKQFERRSMVEADGSFHFGGLPQGTFVVTEEQGVDYADSDDIFAKRQKVVRRYGDVKTTVIIGDHDVAMEDVLLTEDKGKDQPDDAPK